MIPWNQFTSSQQDPDWRIELNEHNLLFYVNKGPSQLRRVLDSPMLESAQERQFVLSQLGLPNVNFETEHAGRMGYAIQLFSKHFITHETDESFCPSSPHYEDLTDFRSAFSYAEPTPSLPMSDLLEGLPSPSSPTPTVKSLRSAKSPMSVESLMNPEISPPSERKRKYSDERFPPIDADDDPEGLEALETPASLKQTFKYARTAKIGNAPTARLRRDTRMRRPNLDRGHSKFKYMDGGRHQNDLRGSSSLLDWSQYGD
ncbi:hypothetical protein PV08_01297 [Exophiala spinifera]|uniref:Uncharacterized protein n=1 Tax=Exophiala spinifera TaxID=91928 RepID=A0A0D2BQF7_9EURO|nr:uncharacterized protein PV08_01297 [Exophiala spinifera]KIW20720.1 hypothetical protein PV08_01297 [Exophiala spinifera]